MGWKPGRPLKPVLVHSQPSPRNARHLLSNRAFHVAACLQLDKMLVGLLHTAPQVQHAAANLSCFAKQTCPVQWTLSRYASSQALDPPGVDREQPACIGPRATWWQSQSFGDLTGSCSSPGPFVRAGAMVCQPSIFRLSHDAHAISSAECLSLRQADPHGRIPDGCPVPGSCAVMHPHLLALHTDAGSLGHQGNTESFKRRALAEDPQGTVRHRKCVQRRLTGAQSSIQMGTAKPGDDC